MSDPSNPAVAAQRPPAFGTLPRQLIQFGIFGLGATAIHYGLMALLITVGLVPLLSSQIGFVAGGTFSYATNRVVTFRSRLPHRTSAPRYLVVAAICWLVNGMGLAVIRDAGAPIWLAQLAATAVVTACSFLLNRVWTFRQRD